MKSNLPTLAERVIEFNSSLAKTDLDLPQEFRVINPFRGPNKTQVTEVATAFYSRFYADNHPRRLILGSSPARRGTALTGVPFADAEVLNRDTGVAVEGYSVSRSSSSFLDEVIEELGGHERFYAKFLMGFVCPLGLVRSNVKGREVNANYYDTKALREKVTKFVTDCLLRQVSFGIDTSVCYCIGSGQNFQFLVALNQAEGIFDKIVPLEHPRYITQYDPKNRDAYKRKYLSALGDYTLHSPTQ
jgi:hypothetical protein